MSGEEVTTLTEDLSGEQVSPNDPPDAVEPARAQGIIPSASPRRDEGHFAKFTERMRLVLRLSEEEAVRLGDPFVGDEHFLLGLVREGAGVAGCVLAAQGITLERTREIVASIPDRGRGIMPFAARRLTPNGEMAIELALREAQRRRVAYVGTEHMLLALTTPRFESIASNVLQHLGVSPSAVAAHTCEVLDTLPQARGGPLPRPENLINRIFRRYTGR